MQYLKAIGLIIVFLTGAISMLGSQKPINDTIKNINFPTVTDITQAWGGANSNPRTFSARVNNISDLWNVRVYVTWSRHFWLDRTNPRAPHRLIEMSSSQGNPMLFTFSPTDAAFYRDADALFYQITMEYYLKNSDASDSVIIDTPRTRFLINANAATVRTALVRIRNSVLSSTPLIWDRRFPHPIIIPAPFTLFRPKIGYLDTGTHGFVSIRQQGIAIPTPFGIAGAALDGIKEGSPDLLLYRAVNQVNAPVLATRTATPSSIDCLSDARYQLVGWAYGGLYDPNKRPSLPGIPSNAWFVHEAGFHLYNGGMTLTPPTEGFLGQRSDGLLPPPGTNIIPAPAALPFFPPRCDAANMIWHPRVWDLHVWLNPRNPRGGTPILSVNAPPGWVIPGITTIPPAAFFTPELPE